MITHFSHLFRSPLPVPQEYRRNFFHLYFDVLWYGVLNGSTLTFLAIFATRSGAIPQQIGLLTAAPALVNLLFTLPMGVWGSRLRLHTATCWAWAATRIFYLFLVPLPFLLKPESQVWAIILIILVMSIPGTLAAIIGNAFFAEVVPEDWRGHVVGTRNALLAVATTLTSLVSGQILEHMPFPTGYQVVFAIGFIGAALSCLHLFLIRMPPVTSPSEKRVDLPDAPLSLLKNFKSQIRLDILRGPFGLVLLLLIFYNLSVFIGQPVFPLYQVRILGFTDQTISLGTSTFWVIYFLGSTQVGMLGRRLGNQKLTTLGISLTAISVLIFMVSYHPLVYLINNIVGGIGWSMLGGSVINFLFERVPADDRTPYLTWYNLAVNAASLVGSLLGSWVAAQIGLVESLVIVILSRLLAAAAIFFWGHPSDRTSTAAAEAGAPPPPSVKARAFLPGCSALIFQLMRMFWLTELALLLVTLYGLYTGWSTPKQWSDGFFIAAGVQLLIAAVTIMDSSSETLDASWVRYVFDGNLTETRQQLVLDGLHRQTLATRMFLGGLLTLLVSLVMLWL